MLRIIDIVRVVAKYKLDDYLSQYDQTKFLNAGGNLIRQFLFIKTVHGPLGYRLRKALEELGLKKEKFANLIYGILIVEDIGGVEIDGKCFDCGNAKDNICPDIVLGQDGYCVGKNNPDSARCDLVNSILLAALVAMKAC